MSVRKSKKRVHFFLVSLLGFLIDFGIINFLYGQDFSLSFSHIISFITASGISCFIILTGSYKDIVINLNSKQFLKFIIITLLILFFRGGILATLINLLNLSSGLAFFICAMMSSILSYMGNIFYGFLQKKNCIYSGKEGYYFFIGVIIYSVLLRFFYLGTPELFYEEAYY